MADLAVNARFAAVPAQLFAESVVIGQQRFQRREQFVDLLRVSLQAIQGFAGYAVRGNAGFVGLLLLGQRVALAGGAVAESLATVETRFRYNPDVKSLIAMVPAIIPLLLLLIPAMLTALSVVREKELGSIVNFYVTPVTRLEFLLGKQLPYIGLAMLNYLLLLVLAITIFDVPLKGSFLTLTLATLIYVTAATAMGLLISSFMRSQVAAMFGTAVLTIVPGVQYCGMIDPVSALEGAGALVGHIYPTTYYLTISRGVFSKALDFMDLRMSFVPLLVSVPVLLALCTVLLKKQGR